MARKIKHNYWLIYQISPDYAIKFSVYETSESAALLSAETFITAYCAVIVSIPGIRYVKSRLRVLRYDDWMKFEALDISFNPLKRNKSWTN